jgi:hypothetical protein
MYDALKAAEASGNELHHCGLRDQSCGGRQHVCSGDGKIVLAGAERSVNYDGQD